MFSLAVHGEEDAAMYFGGLVKAPKFLADVVESLAAAVYVDCDFNLKAVWMVRIAYALLCHLISYLVAVGWLKGKLEGKVLKRRQKSVCCSFYLRCMVKLLIGKLLTLQKLASAESKKLILSQKEF